MSLSIFTAKGAAAAAPSGSRCHAAAGAMTVGRPLGNVATLALVQAAGGNVATLALDEVEDADDRGSYPKTIIPKSSYHLVVTTFHPCLTSGL